MVSESGEGALEGLLPLRRKTTLPVMLEGGLRSDALASAEGIGEDGGGGGGGEGGRALSVSRTRAQASTACAAASAVAMLA